ncbi:2-Hydroxyacid oxidase 2-like isoform X1 [Ptychodera flava]|uniref:2-Hydroxyacid oxidase 2-like isoform X1 n=1 Tax=Ptychodera flava TaxID=63121 RepID=UPI00396A1FEC
MTDKLASVAEYENVFKGRVHEIAWLYYVSGSDEEITLEQNRNAFKRLRLRPRVLQDVSSIDVSASLLGQRVDIPICIAPTAWQGLAHPDAEVATAKAAEKVGTCMILSLHANKSLEEVREKTPKGLKWLNLYLFPNRTVTLDLVRRTENANYNGLVVTIDNPSLGNLIKFHHRKGISIYSRRVNDYHGNGHLEKYLKGYDMGPLRQNGRPVDISIRDRAATWQYFDWLRSQTDLPIIAKGVLTAEDAILAVNNGANAVIVSNHGGRGLDSVPASIEALPEVVRAIGDRVEVYIDGGIRNGIDVFKALALGAKAVFVGRPILYGLAHSGEDGAKQILEILKSELIRTMRFAGCRSLSDIVPSFVVHESHYAKL